MLSALLAFLGIAFAAPLETVSTLDLTRYAGTWYELSRFENSFERGCEGVTATYTIREDGRVTVENRCHKDSPTGPERVARGLARVPDPQFPGRLKVSFFRPFWGDYQVLALDADYRWVVVGSPDRKYLWVLARSAQTPAADYAAGLQTASAQGFDLSRLRPTAQATPAP